MISFAQVWTVQWSDTITSWNVQFQVGIHFTWFHFNMHHLTSHCTGSTGLFAAKHLVLCRSQWGLNVCNSIVLLMPWVPFGWVGNTDRNFSSFQELECSQLVYMSIKYFIVLKQGYPSVCNKCKFEDFPNHLSRLLLPFKNSHRKYSTFQWPQWLQSVYTPAVIFILLRQRHTWACH